MPRGTRLDLSQNHLDTLPVSSFFFFFFSANAMVNYMFIAKLAIDSNFHYYHVI